MRLKSTLAVFFIGIACLLLSGCQANDGEGPQDTFSSLVKLTASDAGDNDSYGLSVAVDGGYALVGAPGEDGAGTNSGAAYLYLQNQGGLDNWGEVKKLVASDPDDNDLFGVSVDISGDYAVVGAGGKDGVGTDRGAAYLFYRNQNGMDAWGQVKKLVASDAANTDGFGFAVAIDGDYAVVGSDGEDGAGTDRGAVYVFQRNQGGENNWGEVLKLTAGDAADADQFGYAVDIKGNDVIIGSPGEDGAGSNRGAAYVFSRDQGGPDNWGQTKKLIASDASNDALFGTTVATGGDLMVVGAAWDDGGGSNRGAAYLFGRNQGGTGNWGQTIKLVASDAHNEDFFGYAVDIAGDFVIAGAPWSGGGGTERGQVYIFSKNEGGPDNWGEAQRLRASDASNEDWFGISLALDGLYILSGATSEDGAGTNRGAVYIFRKI